MLSKEKMETERESLDQENREQNEIDKDYLHLADKMRNEGNLSEAIKYYLMVYESPQLKGAAVIRLKRLIEHPLISLEDIERINTFALESVNNSKENLQLMSIIIKTLNYLGKGGDSIKYCQNLVYSQNLKTKPEFVRQFWGRTRGPDFIIAGFLKCGTTSLYDYMLKHPKILESSQKELMFFNVEKNYSLGLDWYLSNFPPIPENTDYITGEASTLYSLSSVVAERVKTHFPNIKLIFILRNPIYRAISNYYFNQKQIGKKQKTLDKYIEFEIKKINRMIQEGEDIGKRFNGRSGIISSGLYVYFIEKWLNIFPRDQFLFLQTETLANNPSDVIESVFSFLNIPNYPIDESSRKNAGSYPPLDEQLKLKLAEFYEPHNRKLEEYLGIKFGW